MIWLRLTAIGIIVASLICAGVLVSHVLLFVKIFFNHAGIIVSQDEVKAAAAIVTEASDSRTMYIPKIIHQVYHDWKNSSKIPEDWEEMRKTCIDLHMDWEYMLWTEQSSRNFIDREYPWFLSTYDGYAYPVQRVDAVRYFLLRHYGGIYIDLDNSCLENLEPLLYYPTWITDGGRGALSNNILGSAPNHPFWTLLTDSLMRYDWNYFFPYITISYASGQWFETEIWEAYHRSLPHMDVGSPERRLYRILMDDRPAMDHWVFWSQGRGGTWNNDDNRMFLWIGDHLIIFAMGLTVLMGSLLLYAFRCIRSLRRRKHGRDKLINRFKTLINTSRRSGRG